MNKSKLVIIGAGQTGRGFIAPFVENSEYSYCFIDNNKSLINSLSSQKKYKVNYYNDKVSPVIIENKKYYISESSEAVNVIASADVIITAVGKDNISDLIPLLKEGINNRTKKDKLSIILCENGINVKKPLIEEKIDANISEGIIFGTSLSLNNNSLDLLSEDYPNIPYDANVSGIEINIDEFIPEKYFSDMIQRKIYTYNFLSAVISYLGYYKNYMFLSEAANNKAINIIFNEAIIDLNKAISKEYSINFEEQTNFSKLAIEKFKNEEIIDTISRNTRDVARKLSPEERLVRPLRLNMKYNESTKYIQLVIAAAIHYGFKEENLSEETLLNITELDDEVGIKDNVKRIYNLFEEGRDLYTITETL